MKKGVFDGFSGIFRGNIGISGDFNELSGIYKEFSLHSFYEFLIKILKLLMNKCNFVDGICR